MRNRFLGVIAALALLVTFCPKTRGDTVHYLPLNGVVDIIGPTAPNTDIISYVLASGPNIDPPCTNIGGPDSPPTCPYNLVTSTLVVNSLISEYDRNGSLFVSGNVGAYFSNCDFHGFECGEFGQLQLSCCLTTALGLVYANFIELVISTNIGEYGPGTQLISNYLSVTLPDDFRVTPLPAALPLLASGLGALGLICRRRKRKTQLPSPVLSRA